MKLSNLTSIFFIFVETTNSMVFWTKIPIFIAHILRVFGKRGSYFRKQLGVCFRDTPGLVTALDKSKRSLFTFKGVESRGPNSSGLSTTSCNVELECLHSKISTFGDFHTKKKTSGPSGCIFVLTSQVPLNPCYFLVLVTSKLSKQKLGRNLGLRKGV